MERQKETNRRNFIWFLEKADDRAAVEIPPQAYGKKQIAPQGMFQGNDRQRPCDAVSVGKEPAAENTQNRGVPVGIKEVEQAETEAIEKDQAPAAGEQVFIALKEEDPENELLRKGRKQRV